MKCHKCGASMAERSGKFGDFWGCETFPRCRGSAPMNREPSEAPSAPLSELVEWEMGRERYRGDDEAEAWDAFMEQSEAILGRPLSLLEIPDELPSFEEMYGYTPGDQ